MHPCSHNFVKSMEAQIFSQLPEIERHENDFIFAKCVTRNNSSIDVLDVTIKIVRSAGSPASKPTKTSSTNLGIRRDNMK